MSISGRIICATILRLALLFFRCSMTPRTVFKSAGILYCCHICGEFFQQQEYLDSHLKCHASVLHSHVRQFSSTSVRLAGLYISNSPFDPEYRPILPKCQQQSLPQFNPVIWNSQLPVPSRVQPLASNVPFQLLTNAVPNIQHNMPSIGNTCQAGSSGLFPVPAGTISDTGDSTSNLKNDQVLGVTLKKNELHRPVNGLNHSELFNNNRSQFPASAQSPPTQQGVANEQAQNAVTSFNTNHQPNQNNVSFPINSVDFQPPSAPNLPVWPAEINLDIYTTGSNIVETGNSKPQTQVPPSINEQDPEEGGSKLREALELLPFRRECKVCSKIFYTEYDFTRHMRVHEPKQCPVCKKMCKSQKILTNHLFVHREDRPFPCDLCDQKFKRSFFLSAHKRRVHLKIKRFECTLCDYKSDTKQCVVIHMKRHLKEYSVHCEVCGKGFYNVHELNIHKDLHSDKKKFQCDICSTSFLLRGHLRSHYVKVHNKSEKPRLTHQCDTCGEKFEGRKKLYKHRKLHTGEKEFHLCDICGKGLTSRSSLEDHKRRHSGEKPYECGYCEKRFTTRNSLETHVRTHTGERPFSCKECGKSFTQHSTLIVHRRYHTGQRPYTCSRCDKGFVTLTLLKTHQKTPCRHH